ncbi:ABC-type transport auxiliary lipoprotein family protein [Altererythrobacter arenosus]|uniref:ABC-type transport auxiliary lipoprotein family protein n=1 Tax=Altererythrobacter arenosus TaxID=3032592 RepID=A0ABY8FSU9_9SPHN|nr:ABC-type transport auxiliary lipoprotein family protein [Altererythrobacter sp. CAU 1644]WFL78088.1 ABC-type transport auxiliary lipoprotein family protein [Altererythrobacter sp. CAU 1644]
MTYAARTARLAYLAPLVMLAGCISLGEDPPDRLLTLTSQATTSAGTAQSAQRSETIIIHEPGVPASLDVTRVPVQVNSTEIAYLKDALWVEKPSRLFRRLLAETMRAKTGRVVLDGDDPAFSGGENLRGTLRAFGYDASNSSVVVQFDAIRQGDGGRVETRRFEAVEQGVLAEAAPVGDALNRAANRVAEEVADWVSGS